MAREHHDDGKNVENGGGEGEGGGNEIKIYPRVTEKP